MTKAHLAALSALCREILPATRSTIMFDPFRRRQDLIVHSTEPYDADPRLDRLRAASTIAQWNF